MNRIALRRHRLGVALALAALALAGAGAAAPAEAQTLSFFGCKIVCGFERGNIRLLNDTGPSPANEPFEDLKPGNYATTCNIFNYDIFTASQPVFPYLAREGAGLVFLGTVDVPALNTAAIGCIDVAANLPAPPPTIYEGYLVLFTTSTSFRTDSVHTYASQNAFERHVLWQYNPFGAWGILFQSLGLSLPRITTPLVGGGAFGSQHLTGTGAGGLGLGASIDVEEVRRIDIDLSTTTDEDRERIPAEVRDATGL